MTTQFHIGNLIRQKLTEQERRPAWLAKKLNCDSSNIYKILHKNHLDSLLLLQISIIMQHDFFVYYSEEFHIQCEKHEKEEKNN